jgi:hypothetical protein
VPERRSLLFSFKTLSKPWGFPKLEEQQAIVSFIEVASRELNAIIDMVSREIALLQEFRTRGEPARDRWGRTHR